MLGLREVMDRSEGWGRAQGREVYQRLLRSVEENPGTLVFRVSMKGVERVDISFASETVVELARRYRGNKGFASSISPIPTLSRIGMRRRPRRDSPCWSGKARLRA